MKVICTAQTPLQLMNCINMVLNHLRNDEVDLLVERKFANSDKIITMLLKEKLFRNVYIGTEDNIIESIYTKNGECDRFVQTFLPGLYIKIFLDSNYKLPNDYEAIYFSNYTPLEIVLITYCKKAQVYYYDDGFASYFGDIGYEQLERKLTKFKKYYYKLFYGGTERYYGREIYVNNVDLCDKCWNDMSVQKRKLGDFSDRFFIEVLERIFSYKDDELYKIYKKIILTQPGFTSKNENQIYKIFNKSDVLLRMHPREKYPKLLNVNVDKINNMWELLALKDIDNEHVLIGIGSTAQFFPKVLFNKEPKLVFLYPLFKECFEPDRYFDFNRLIQTFKNMYVEKNKVVIVETFDDLIALKI